jgi:hypothetical protein
MSQKSGTTKLSSERIVKDKADRRAHQLLARKFDHERPIRFSLHTKGIAVDVGAESVDNVPKAFPALHPVSVARHRAASVRLLCSRL